MPFFGDIGRILIFIGIFIVLLGLGFMFGPKIPFLGKLPGDIVIQKENFSFHFPLVTCILISLGLTILLNFIFWILRR